MTKTLVIGLGNPILADDGVGIYTARAVRAVLPPNCNVDIVELAVGGLTLMEAMIDYDEVILIDAIYTPHNNHQIGEILVFDAGHLPETLNSKNSHDVDLPTALELGKQLGAKLPDINNIQIVAIRAADILTFSESLTPQVEASLPQAALCVLKLLGCPTII